MELTDALRTTGAIRAFTDEPVADDVVFEILDDARFAPSGGNRQAWRVAVVKNPETRRAVRDLYVDAWRDYCAHLLAGIVPFSPLAGDAELVAVEAQREAASALSEPDGFAATLDRVPVMLAVGVDLRVLAATDRDLGRYQLVGGASVYPFVWSVLLAARERGLGGVMTTVATRNEVALRQVLAFPDDMALASIVVLGHPRHRPARLRRNDVSTFVTVDTFDGPTFAPGSP
jgi:nitroreductase